MNKTRVALMFAVLLTLTAFAGCLYNPQEENSESAEESSSESTSIAGCASPPCAQANREIVTAETRGDKLAPVPDGAEGYWFGHPLEANQSTGWITPVENTVLHVNSAGKPFWVCAEVEFDSGIADWCSHYYRFQYNAFEGWDWNGVASGNQRIQIRADWDDTMVYMTNVPLEPHHGEKG